MAPTRPPSQLPPVSAADLAVPGAGASEGVAAEAEVRAAWRRSASFVAAHRGGRLLFVNAAAAALLGHEDEDALVGRQLLEFVALADREAAAAWLAAPAAGLRDVSGGELLLRRRDGLIVPLRCVALPIVMDGGPAVLLVGQGTAERPLVPRDLVHAPRPQGPAAKAASDLARPLEDLTADLRRLARDVGRRAAPAAPEEAALWEGLRAALLEAQESATLAMEVVRLLRATTPTEPHDDMLVDVRGVLELTLRLHEREIRARARLTREFGEVPLVGVDEVALVQAFLCVLARVVRTIPPGDAERHQLLVRVHRADGFAVVEVEAAGDDLGRRRRDLASVRAARFEAAELRRDAELSAVYGLVERCGGELEIERAPGSGGRYRVRLPGERIDLSPADESAPPAPTLSAVRGA